MSKLFQRVLLALTLTMSSIGILSSCITLQDMRKPRHNQSQKKKHPNTTRIEYKIKTLHNKDRDYVNYYKKTFLNQNFKKYTLKKSGISQLVNGYKNFAYGWTLL